MDSGDKRLDTSAAPEGEETVLPELNDNDIAAVHALEAARVIVPHQTGDTLRAVAIVIAAAMKKAIITSKKAAQS